MASLNNFNQYSIECRKNCARSSFYSANITRQRWIEPRRASNPRIVFVNFHKETELIGIYAKYTKNYACIFSLVFWVEIRQCSVCNIAWNFDRNEINYRLSDWYKSVESITNTQYGCITFRMNSPGRKYVWEIPAGACQWPYQTIFVEHASVRFRYT